MKFLVVIKGSHVLRPYAETFRELASRGHQLRIASLDETGDAWARGTMDAGLASTPGVSFLSVPDTRSEHSREVALIRRVWNYLRYLDAPYRGASKLRGRAFDKVARLVFERGSTPLPEWGERALGLTPREVRRLQTTLEYVESLIPPDPACLDIVRRERPDAVLISPMVDLNASTQAEFAKSARALDIPVGALVYSWDNLSTKGGFHVVPDCVFVWNKRQYREATDLHDVPLDRVAVVGAPRFDAFLQCKPRLSRVEFCRALGLEHERPIVTYVCSSAFVSGSELGVVLQWRKAIRSSGSSVVSGANVVVRPHPDIDLTGSDQPYVKVQWPVDDIPAQMKRLGRRAVVLTTVTRSPQGLFECLKHSDAVVGLNTSAEIEAGLLGKPVLTVLADKQAADGQQDTLHFRYLLREQRGFVDVADSWAAHVEQLEAALSRTPEEQRELRRRAVRFVRPHGAEKPVFLLLADAIEQRMRNRASVAPAVNA